MRALVALCAAVVLLAACGKEDRETRLYGENAAQHAGDTVAWSNPPFNGDRAAWDREMEKRARLLNEYSRIR